MSPFQCDDACGFVAAIGGAICYGTYGVPIKATSSVDAHPLVLQSYKTLVVFLASMLIVLAEEQPRWTSYGLLSGLLWVCGGTLGILAIRNAGIATAVGIWSSIMVIINFVWGILVFHEPVHSLSTTCGAFFWLGIGLVGMTKYSAPGRNDDSDEKEPLLDTEELENFVDSEASSADDLGLTSRAKRGDGKESIPHSSPQKGSAENEEHEEYLGGKDAGRKNSLAKQIFGRSLTPWETGAIYAALNGVLAGSSLVPLHYAKLEGISHFSYYFSFTSGALIVNILMWVLLFLSMFVNTHDELSIGKTIESMPSLHFKQLWLKLVAAGLLSNGGMFGAIMATSSLGQAIGNSLIQLKILISGLWGICYFKETKDRQSTVNWFLSASMCVASILCLSYEKVKVNQDLEQENELH
eukprot:CAMPEP_0116135994 /NCGR_PEP_ID=MMETSP0329-20121206/11485_1 /TAXON_ID=697910 /ORGANISM="Pseudo-nitzschia arenysensis, Strain B593" /LENGTH=410 /DNA_ID=CAMNT_0003630827 /DNA_START=113 /DNA_END=1345 /DNA_ORIENTATION=-